MRFSKLYLVVVTMFIIQTSPLTADETKLDESESRYRLPSSEYDDGLSVNESRRSLMTDRQMAISRAVKKARQRRNRIAIQKLTGRSISRPVRNQNRSFNLYHSPVMYHPYQGIPWSHRGQIRIQTAFE